MAYPSRAGCANDEDALYRRAGLSYPPRQSLFTHVNELALVVGLPPALVDRALPFVTVFNGSSDIDPRSRRPEVIAALPGKTSANPNDVLGQQPPSSNNAPVATADSSGPAQSNATTAKSSAYRIETTINFNDGRRSASEVVIAIGDKDKEDPYRVLSWHDDLEPRVVLRKRTGL